MPLGHSCHQRRCLPPWCQGHWTDVQGLLVPLSPATFLMGASSRATRHAREAWLAHQTSSGPEHLSLCLQFLGCYPLRAMAPEKSTSRLARTWVESASLTGRGLSSPCATMGLEPSIFNYALSRRHCGLEPWVPPRGHVCHEMHGMDDGHGCWKTMTRTILTIISFLPTTLSSSTMWFGKREPLGEINGRLAFGLVRALS